MIARPKMSQNEWKTTEIRASKVGQRLTLFLPRRRDDSGAAATVADELRELGRATS